MGVRLKTDNQNVKWWRVQNLKKKRHQGSSKSTHHPVLAFHIRLLEIVVCLRGNRRITFHSPPGPSHTSCVLTPAVPLLPDSSSARLYKPLDVIAPPQTPKGFPGNATATYCNRGQQSVDLSPSGGRPQGLQCWGSSGWLVIFPCSLNPFSYSLSPGQSVCSFIQTEICVQPVVTSLKNLEGEFQKTGVKLGGGIADSQSKAAQRHCFPLEASLAGPYRSTLADRMFTCATCHYIALPCLVCQSQRYNTVAEMFPPYPGPTKSLLHTCQWVQCDSG